MLAKNKILARKRNSGEKSKFWPEIEIRSHNLCRKIEIMAKNRNSDQKSNFCRKIEIMAKNPNSDKKSKFSPKILAKNRLS